MSERKNLKVAVETYDKLRDEKRKHETWDHFFNRMIRETEEK